MGRYGIEKASFVGPTIWKSTPSIVKNSSLLEKFKAKIGRWTPATSPANFAKPMLSV